MQLETLRYKIKNYENKECAKSIDRSGPLRSEISYVRELHFKK